MPSIMTHYICGLKAFDRATEKHISSIIGKHMDLFSLGTLGPDIFFFSVSAPFIIKPSNAEIGHRMHKPGIKMFYRFSTEFAKSLNEEEREIVYAYLAGFLCHYALDTYAHPYVFYRTGFSDEEGDLKYPYAAYHERLESAIDTILCNDMLEKTPYEINIAGKMRATPKECGVIANLYAYALKKAYGFDRNTYSLKKTLSAEQSFYKFFNRNHEFKKRAIRLAERCIGREGMLSYLVQDAKIGEDDKNDYLNIKHSPWYNPWDNTRQRNQSFLLLFENAVSQTVFYHKVLYDLLYTGETDGEKLLMKLGNKSFETGQEEDVPFKYFDCMF